jgi:hypothetical protein
MAGMLASGTRLDFTYMVRGVASIHGIESIPYAMGMALGLGFLSSAPDRPLGRRLERLEMFYGMHIHLPALSQPLHFVAA